MHECSGQKVIYQNMWLTVKREWEGIAAIPIYSNIDFLVPLYLSSKMLVNPNPERWETNVLYFLEAFERTFLTTTDSFQES